MAKVKREDLPAMSAAALVVFFEDVAANIGDLNSGFAWEPTVRDEDFATPFFASDCSGAFTLADRDHIVVVERGKVVRLVHKARAEDCGVADAEIMLEQGRAPADANTGAAGNGLVAAQGDAPEGAVAGAPGVEGGAGESGDSGEAPGAAENQKPEA